MPHRYLWRKIRRFFIYRVLSLDDTPHRIALGLAIGIFVTFTPTIGLQMVLTVGLSVLLGANKFVGVPFVWISNPFTFIPLYGPSFLLGSRILGASYSWDNFVQRMRAAMTLEGGGLASLQRWWQATWPILPPLWLGSLIIGGALAVLTYALTFYGVIAFRKTLHYVEEHLPHHHRKEGKGEET